MKKIYMFLVSLFAMVILTACSTTPKGVVDDYYAELKKGNVEKALTEYTDYSDAEINGYVKKVEGLKIQILDYDIIEEEISEDGLTAKVRVSQTTTNSIVDKEKTEVTTVSLEKKDGVWKICK